MNEEANQGSTVGGSQEEVDETNYRSSEAHAGDYDSEPEYVLEVDERTSDLIGALGLMAGDKVGKSRSWNQILQDLDQGSTEDKREVREQAAWFIKLAYEGDLQQYVRDMLHRHQQDNCYPNDLEFEDEGFVYYPWKRDGFQKIAVVEEDSLQGADPAGTIKWPNGAIMFDPDSQSLFYPHPKEYDGGGSSRDKLLLSKAFQKDAGPTDRAFLPGLVSDQGKERPLIMKETHDHGIVYRLPEAGKNWSERDEMEFKVDRSPIESEMSLEEVLSELED